MNDGLFLGAGAPVSASVPGGLVATPANLQSPLQSPLASLSLSQDRMESMWFNLNSGIRTTFGVYVTMVPQPGAAQAVAEYLASVTGDDDDEGSQA